MTCGQCGAETVSGANFCARCGAPLDPSEVTATMALPFTDDLGLSDAEAAAVDALRAGQALLVVQRGPGAGSRFLLDSDVVSAGRHPESDIFLDDVTVSRHHAEFARSGDRFSVRDSGSLNGTYVNRDRIEETELQDGDEVQVGKFRLVFLSGARSAE